MTPESIAGFRRIATEAGYASRSTEGCINDVVMIAAIATGRRVPVGQRLPRRRPQPTPTPLETIDRIYQHSRSWVRQWLALTFGTCLRLQDSLSLQRTLKRQQYDVLTWQASKTGTVHQYPVPEWLQRHILLQVIIPNGKTYCHLQDMLRMELGRASRAAGVDPVLPKFIRQRALTEWNAADATAGSIIHGCGLGVLDHYVDPLRILSSAVYRVALPPCFGASQVPDISRAYSRLDPDAQQLVSRTIERLTG